MRESFPRVFDVFRRANGQRRSSRIRNRRRPELMTERLERRELLAITTVGGGPVSNYLIVASDDASEVFVQRRADGNLLIADNSSFLVNSNFSTSGTPDILYVTNGAAGVGPGPMFAGNNTGFVNPFSPALRTAL